MNKDIAKILSELEENDKEILDILDKLTQRLTTTCKKVDILWGCQFGKGSKLADDDILFPTLKDDDDDDCDDCPDFDECFDDYLEVPLPVKRFKDKRSGEMVDVSSSSIRSLIEKIGEELLEVTAEYGKYLGGEDTYCLAVELGDTITACLTLLERPCCRARRT